jgi:Putative beta-lactamase-inhibitor-like, PepSY-like
MKLPYLWILLIVLNALSTAGLAQARPTPPEVTSAFNTMFPNAGNVKWRDKITNFAAFFDMQGKKCEAKFSPGGSWISTEEAIQSDSVPQPITDSLKSVKYAGWTENSAYILKSAGAMTQYHVVVTNNESVRKILFFNQNGQLLQGH